MTVVGGDIRRAGSSFCTFRRKCAIGKSSGNDSLAGQPGPTGQGKGPWPARNPECLDMHTSYPYNHVRGDAYTVQLGIGGTGELRRRTSRWPYG